MRNIAAILLAPLAPAILSIGLPVLLTQSWPFNESDYKILILFAGLAGYFGMAIIGLPSIALLRRFNRLNIFNLLVVGAVSGIFIYTIFLLLLGILLNTASSFNLLTTALYGTVFGISVSLTYGLISGISWRSG